MYICIYHDDRPTSLIGGCCKYVRVYQNHGPTSLVGRLLRYVITCHTDTPTSLIGGLLNYVRIYHNERRLLGYQDMFVSSNARPTTRMGGGGSYRGMLVSITMIDRSR